MVVEIESRDHIKMKNLKIKICGMKDFQNIVEVGTLFPDYMGFIFWKKSARYFNGILPELPKSIKKVGVFVDASVLEIQKKVKQYNLHMVQLHGHESPEFCMHLKKELPDLTVIKVFSIKEDFNFKSLSPFELVCDYFLFDTQGKLPGGNGYSFDWKLLEKYPSIKPFFLSGGIGIEELDAVKAILRTDLPIHAIDLNSKLEVKPGQKNITSCREVISYFNK